MSIRERITQRLEESAVEMVLSLYGGSKKGSLKKSKHSYEDHKKNWQPLQPKAHKELEKYYTGGEAEKKTKKKHETNTYMTKDGHKVERISNGDKLPHIHKVTKLDGGVEHYVDTTDHVSYRKKAAKEKKKDA